MGWKTKWIDRQVIELTTSSEWIMDASDYVDAKHFLAALAHLVIQDYTGSTTAGALQLYMETAIFDSNYSEDWLAAASSAFTPAVTPRQVATLESSLGGANTMLAGPTRIRIVNAGAATANFTLSANLMMKDLG